MGVSSYLHVGYYLECIKSQIIHKEKYKGCPENHKIENSLNFCPICGQKTINKFHESLKYKGYDTYQTSFGDRFTGICYQNYDSPTEILISNKKDKSCISMHSKYNDIIIDHNDLKTLVNPFTESDIENLKKEFQYVEIHVKLGTIIWHN